MSSTDPDRQPRRMPQRVEWPTLWLAGLIHVGWLLLTLLGGHLAWWLLLPPAAWISAWHMSLQHEVIHGHPTRWQRLNDALGFAPLSLWLPYQRYRALHLAHHDSGWLTDPLDDPESHYVSSARLAGVSAPRRLLWRAHNTLLGRIMIGPIVGMLGFLVREVRLAPGQAAVRRSWAWHLLAAALLLAWLRLVCHLPLGLYLACFVYPGYGLSLVRSFAEHRAARFSHHRTATVEKAPVLGLLFLYNNLHVLHHLQPGLPWFRLPSVYRAERTALLRRNGGLVYEGYGDVARRYLLRVHDRPDNIHGRPIYGSPDPA